MRTHAELDRTYRELLRKLDLHPNHLEALYGRALSDQEIAKAMFKTMPPGSSDTKAYELDREGVELEGIPGFYFRDGQWKLRIKAGLIIPIRNLSGQVIGLKARADYTDDPAKKYMTASTPPRGDLFPRGAAARPAIHVPASTTDDQKASGIVRITEGEFKAESATAVISDSMTIGLPGVGHWKLAIDWLKSEPDFPVRKVRVAFDADAWLPNPASYDRPDGTKTSVALSLGQLYTALINEGYSVEVEKWEMEDGKGIDDALCNGVDIGIVDPAEFEPWLEETIAEGPLAKWVMFYGLKRFMDLETRRLYDPEAFNFIHAPNEDLGANPAKTVLRDPSFPRFHAPIYAPRRPKQLEDDEGKRTLNLWRPSMILPREGETGLWDGHVAYLFEDERERSILLDFLAYNVQSPGKKIQWAMLIQGKQGTGKSFIGEVMARILGAHNVSFPSNDELHEKYTAWQKHCSLVVVNEVMAKGRLELMNKLKPIITEGTTRIREMYTPAYTQPNTINLLLLTNYKDSILLEDDDRRYCVLSSSAERNVHDEEYYRQLWNWMRAEGASAVYHALEARDLSQFNPHGCAPITDAKRDLIKVSRRPEIEWIEDGIRSATYPFKNDVISPKDLADVAPPRMRGIRPQQIATALEKVGALRLGRIDLPTKEKPVLYALRHHGAYKRMVKAEIGRRYAEQKPFDEPDASPLEEGRP